MFLTNGFRYNMSGKRKTAFDRDLLEIGKPRLTGGLAEKQKTTFDGDLPGKRKTAHKKAGVDIF
ncbi:MAG: hypothetical protein LBT55_05560 [Clostridiaceae bacterium]|nr:hypothetical protein [Clostridiaceae bacterium]